MRNLKSILILLGVFVILLAGYFTYQKYGRNTDKNTGTTTKYETIIKVDKENIDEVTINYNAESVKLVKKGQDFVVDMPENINTDKMVIDNIISRLGNLRSDKIIFEGVGDITQFGFDNPIASIDVKLLDGTVENLKIGSMSPSKNGYYIKSSKGNKIYLLSIDDADNLLIDKTKIKSSSD